MSACVGDVYDKRMKAYCLIEEEYDIPKVLGEFLCIDCLLHTDCRATRFLEIQILSDVSTPFRLVANVDPLFHVTLEQAKRLGMNLRIVASAPTDALLVTKCPLEPGGAKPTTEELSIYFDTMERLTHDRLVKCQKGYKLTQRGQAAVVFSQLLSLWDVRLRFWSAYLHGRADIFSSSSGITAEWDRAFSASTNMLESRRDSQIQIHKERLLKDLKSRWKRHVLRLRDDANYMEGITIRFDSVSVSAAQRSFVHERTLDTIWRNWIPDSPHERVWIEGKSPCECARERWEEIKHLNDRSPAIVSDVHM
mgnify:CR=1 FL=1